jgi:magnesium transporter
LTRLVNVLTTGTKHPSQNIRTLEKGGLKWVDVLNPTEAEVEWLKEKYAFHPLALDDVLSRIQMPKLDDYETYLFLVLHFPVFDPGARITRPLEVDFFVGSDYVITVQNGELRPLSNLFHECEINEELRSNLMRRSSGYLLYRILDVLVDYCFPILNKVIENVDKLEDSVFDDRSQNIVREISIVRRDIIAYRRIIRPQIGVLESLEQGDVPFLKVDPDVYFGDLADHIRRIWDELEELKEVIEGLGTSHSSLSVYHTNQVIRILTFLATMMMPPTLIASIYGMNVALPFDDHPAAFGIVMGMILAVTALMLVLLWRRRWI